VIPVIASLFVWSCLLQTRVPSAACRRCAL
jgi:hypothetical protein